MVFSDIQNIGSGFEPLKAEAVDSRLNERKNKENSKGDNNKNSRNDASEIVQEAESNRGVNRFSVDALIFFLEDVLEDRSDYSYPKTFSLAPWIQSKPEQPRNVIAMRNALRAYAHSTKLSCHREKPEKPESGNEKDIYNLIYGLRTLKEQGVTHLDVSNGEGLLEGIGTAIRKG